MPSDVKWKGRSLRHFEETVALVSTSFIVTTSKALVTTSVALVSTSFIVTTSKALVSTSVALVSTSFLCSTPRIQ